MNAEFWTKIRIAKVPGPKHLGPIFPGNTGPIPKWPGNGGWFGPIVGPGI